MKKVLIAILGLIILGAIVLGVLTAISPTEFKVQRQITIDKPRSEVFDYAKILKNQNDWGPWVKKDPKIKLNYTGTDGEVGFITKWESEMEDVGYGEQEIKKIVDGERIESELRFKKPWESKSQAFFITEDAGEGKTKVTWGFSGTMDRPMNIMMLFMDMDSLIGKDFEQGLANLKSIVEKQKSREAVKPEDQAAEKDTDNSKEKSEK
ncbi:MAG: SRPBCC family protein [Acidobacteria bacterium]|nr:SRPBCC family protein [Acidobacteriota bacterium]